MGAIKKFLRDKNILLLWSTRAFSRFGDAMEMLALLYLVYDITGSGLAMGSLMLFSVLPNAIISPIAGVVSDKYNKNKIMFVSEMVRTVCIIFIPILMVTNLIELWHIYTISVLVSIAESFFEPTAGTAMVLVVGKKDMPVFNSVATISNHIMRILGYSLSGILIATVGKEIIFVIDGITFLASALAALFIKIPFKENISSEKSPHFMIELIEGFKYVFTNKIIIAILFVILMIEFLGTPLQIYIPLIIERVLKVKTVWSGYFATATIVGAIIGNILYPILNKTFIKLHHIYLVGILILGLFIGGCGYIINPIYYTAMFFISGLVSSLIGVWSFTEIQMRVDTSYLGRVVSIVTMVMLISSPLAGVVFGGLADKVYIPTIFKYLSVIWVIVAIISYISIKLSYRKNKDEMLNQESVNLN
ncbi:MAG: MFS transporter [Clostridium sp.]|uniref:MFS transporter n=1 Tax=Clostridium sp. TaxID=1506 RepID=UPI003D6CD9F8